MQIAIVNNNQVVKIEDSSVLFPNVSFPASGPDAGFLAQNSAMEVVVWAPFDAATQKQERVEPYVKDGKVFTFNTVEKTAAELAAEAVKAQEAFVASIVSQVQAKLDDFAKTRNYDGILSACTYATSTIPQFKAEGQKAVELRDATWSALYTLLAEVNAGTKPAPTSMADIEAVLPAFVW
jgi:hypothetical protein